MQLFRGQTQNLHNDAQTAIDLQQFGLLLNATEVWSPRYRVIF